MKCAFVLVLFVMCKLSWSQPNTEVYLLELEKKGGEWTVTNLENISENDGYDNQPSFLGNSQMLYASTRNGQTDIALRKLDKNNSTWITNSANGSEYSPLKIPLKNAISAIRLDTNGLQRLYTHDLTTGAVSELLHDVKVGYHLWYSDTIIVATVLVDNRMDLIVADLKKDTQTIVETNVGRSLHKIPNSKKVSFVRKEDGGESLWYMDLVSGETGKIINLTAKSEDVCWLADGTLLTAYGNILLKYKPATDAKWNPLANFKEYDIDHISRLAVNENNTKLALVAEASSEAIIQKQVEAFNTGNLDAFVSCFTDQVLVQNFPTDTLYVGNTRMKKNYMRYLSKNPDARVEVTKRISIGSTVIDAELGTVAGKSHKQAAIYELEGGKIARMTFVHDNHAKDHPEITVKKQLEAYNSRDIEAFLGTYADKIQLYNYPNDLILEGIAAMRSRYGDFFTATPDLHCEIKNRIIVGNKVIDEEYLTVNGTNFSAVAIYEVENGKITKVTFVR